MRYRITGALIALFVTGFAVGAEAQEKRVLFTLGGGLTVPNSEARDHFGDGYNFTIGCRSMSPR